MHVDTSYSKHHLISLIDDFWEISKSKIDLIEREYNKSNGSPVFTRRGKYTSRNWTDWTEGFVYGSAIYQFDATGEERYLDMAKKMVKERMAFHVSHTGVHDHGFNNMSTYGNLLRLMIEGKIKYNEWEKLFYELALKVSGAVQAARWTNLGQEGYIYSFNGPHSLFVDTLRSCRILIVSHMLGHLLYGENEEKIDLATRAIQHASTTARYNIYRGDGRDSYDEAGRVAHESIFNVKSGQYRSPGSQQGYSGFTTWTRGLAWAICGFAELAEWAYDPANVRFFPPEAMEQARELFIDNAVITSEYYLKNTPSDGIPLWDTGAPGIVSMPGYREKPADPFNNTEPVDSSAAAIAAQGLLRLGNVMSSLDREEMGQRFLNAGIQIVIRLLQPPYISLEKWHQGLMLHSVYHQPMGWDYKPEGAKIPTGESCMWGDYHLREVCLYLRRYINSEKYLTFYSCAQ